MIRTCVYFDVKDVLQSIKGLSSELNIPQDRARPSQIRIVLVFVQRERVHGSHEVFEK